MGVQRGSGLHLLQRIEGARGALKVFPLPSSVLFPGTVLPLHIFEPRYRALLSDCLAQDEVMALAQPQPGWESDYEGRPPLRPICCAGVVAWHEKLPDGRFNIVLRGVVRARILGELAPEKPYREVRVQLLPDAPHPSRDDELLRQAVLETSAHLPGEVAQALVQMAAGVSGGALADAVAAALVPDVERRQQLLAELDVAARLKGVVGEVGELLARLSPVKPEGPVN